MTLVGYILLYFLLKFLGHFQPPQGMSIENKEFRAQISEGKYLKLNNRIEKGREILIIRDIGKFWNSYKNGDYKLIESYTDNDTMFLTYERIDSYDGAYYPKELKIVYGALSNFSFNTHTNTDKMNVKFVYKSNNTISITFLRYFSEEEPIE